jgi:hypothetical protein
MGSTLTKEADVIVLPNTASDSWRTWLMAAAAVALGVAAATVLAANPATTSSSRHSQAGGAGVQTAAPGGMVHTAAAANDPVKQAITAGPTVAVPRPGELPGQLPSAESGEPIVPALPSAPSLKVRLPVPVNDPTIPVTDISKLWR